MRFSALMGIFLMLVLTNNSAQGALDGKTIAVAAKTAPAAGKTNPTFRNLSGAKTSGSHPKRREGEILVKFKAGTTEETRKNLHKKHGAEKLKEFNPLRLHHVKLKKGMRVEEAIKLYKADSAVEYAEENFLYARQSMPNDIRFGELWGLQNIGQNGGTAGADIKAPAAWDITTGSSEVVVAVIDSGIDYNHPDLAPNVWVNPTEIAGNGIDDDHNGYIDDIHGIDTTVAFGTPTDPMDSDGHGTHIAGIIGAAGNNAIGVAGVNWSVKIASCKFLDTSGYGSTDQAMSCLMYIKGLKDSGVNVVAINASWGGQSESLALAEFISFQNDTLFVAASANYGENIDNIPVYPAAYRLPNVISVAASDNADKLASFSNYGKRSVHVAAPGVGILSTLPETNAWNIAGGYGTLSGTSMAAPYVTGLVALLKAANPARDWRAVRNLVLSGGDPIPSLTSTTASGRRINAYGSLTCSGQNVFSVVETPAEPHVGISGTISALSIACDAPVGGVEATASAGEKIILLDDGVPPDLAAEDGIFTATWIPLRVPESLTFSSPAGTETVAFPEIWLEHFVPAANLGLPYRQSLRTRGGIKPFSWSSTGALPPGLAFNQTTGELTGIPTQTGVWSAKFSVTDAMGVSVSHTVGLHVVDSPIEEEWGRVLHTPYEEEGTAVATDAGGNVYAVTTVGVRADIMVEKYDPSGELLWSYRYDGGDDEFASAATVTPAGDLLISGANSVGYLVLKVSASGELVWLKEGGAASLWGIAANADGSVMTTGEVWFESNWQAVTIKLSPEGVELWQRIYSNVGTGSSTSAIAVDASGNAYVAGGKERTSTNQFQYLLMKYDPQGNLLWASTDDTGSPSDMWDTVALDSAGNAYVSGHRTGMQVTRKYDASGNMIWSRDFNAGATPDRLGIAVDGAGRAYVAGFRDQPARAFNILCYSAAGELLWSRTSAAGVPSNDYPSGIPYEDAAVAIALAPGGKIAVTGYSSNGIDHDMLTIQYALASMTMPDQELPPAFLFTPYSYAFRTSQGIAPFSWSVTSGALPDGIALDTAGGQLSGTPLYPGTYSFTVQVADAMGRVSQKTVELSAGNITADFTANQTVGYAPLLVGFTDASTGASSNWSWNFGDGGTSVSRNPSHLYTTPGNFTVSLTAANSAGNHTKTVTNAITVLACFNQPTRIAGAVPASFPDLQTAYGQAQDNDIIQLQALDFSGDLLFDRDIRIRLKGGYDCGYTMNPATAGMSGKLVVSNGTVEMENLRLK